MHQQHPEQDARSDTGLCSGDLLGSAGHQSPCTGHPCTERSSLAAGEKCPEHKLSEGC